MFKQLVVVDHCHESNLVLSCLCKSDELEKNEIKLHVLYYIIAVGEYDSKSV